MAGQPKPRATSSFFPSPLYLYLETENAKHARTEGKRLFGSYSAYVNALIAKDRKVKPKLGFWQAPGEAKKKRLLRETKKKFREKRKIAKKVAKKIAKKIARRNAVS